MSFALLALLAFQAPLDEGTFVIREDTVEVARETFRLSQIPIGRSETGWRLGGAGRYGRRQPIVILAYTLEVGSDSQPLSLSMDIDDPREPLRIRSQMSRGRLTVRLLGRRTEQAREFPVMGRTIVIEDSLFSLYVFAASLAGPQPVDVTAIEPRAGRRETLKIEDLGVIPTTLNGAAARLRHITLTGGANRLVHLWLDTDGHLRRVEIPSRRLRTERLPPA